jgi:hypothetical protein
MASLKPEVDLVDLYDPVRSSWVKKRPEELIRQVWTQKLTIEFGFPLSLLAVEKELASLPHLQHMSKKNIPKRRIDILAFAKGIHKEHLLFPLLVIECKATALDATSVNQVISYNMIAQAPFVAVVNESQVLLGSYDKAQGRFCFEEGMRSYQELVSSL